jgi:thiamine pyrophosphate-dependent acetolactate synthase large subunit-like protein
LLNGLYDAKLDQVAVLRHHRHDLSRSGRRNLPHHTSDTPGRGTRVPESDSPQDAAALLNAGHRVAILAGQGTPASQAVMEGCDTLLMVGTSFPYIEFLGEKNQASFARQSSARSTAGKAS